jgi:phosphoribosylformylglycinamidine synthase
VEVALDGAPANAVPLLFAEELGLVLETAEGDAERVMQAFRRANVPCVAIGHGTAQRHTRITVGGTVVLDQDVGELRDLWEATSFELDRLQADADCVRQEREGLRHRTAPPFSLTFRPEPTAPAILARERKPLVAIIREEGSNSDRELAAAFHLAGFEAWDVTMSDLREGRISLERFRGLAFVGGFSYADVLDSAKGWAGGIRFNQGLRRQFDAFYQRPDTFTLGVCNGCQLHALLGWVPWPGIADHLQPRFVQNASGRFESRFTTLTVQPGPSLMLRGMEGSTLGIWLAHGEGRAYFPDPTVLDQVERDGLAPLRFVDDHNRVTEAYPFNPNGSPRGIAALCSPNGRHLALMPHPERSFLPWQWGWMPESWRGLEVSPWMRLFQNAREWCDGVS